MELNDKVSKYFTLNEATYLPSWKTNHIPSDEELENIKKLAQIMDRVRDYFDSPCRVHVWIRPAFLNNPNSEHHGQNYNKLVGGAPKSAHIVGNAVDFDIEGKDCDTIRSLLLPLLEAWNLRMEDNPGSNWVHLDINPVLSGHSRFFKI